MRIGNKALGMLLAPALIAGCGQPQLVPANPMLVNDAMLVRAGPVCTGSRIGQAQCDVSIELGSLHQTSSGWTAGQLEKAYDLPSSSKGEGQTVAVVDAYDNPRVAKDLAVYRAAMGLPRVTFKKYNQLGEQSNYPSGSPTWGVEIALDVEMVSASCPKCRIYLIEADSNEWRDLGAAEAEAVKLGATIVSNSYTSSHGDCLDFDTKGVTYLASSGDNGYGVFYPAACRAVVAVGGTQLSKSGGKRGFSERLWSYSNGGCSTQPKPPWQRDSNCKHRVANDVAAVAEGVAEYDTYPEGGWFVVQGTSISSPLLAGVFGLAGNSTHEDGGRTFWFPAHHKYLYQLTKPRYSRQGGWGSPEGIGAF